ncbi:uncharacterized protein LOC118529067 [Halichoerus grypus]
MRTAKELMDFPGPGVRELQIGDPGNWKNRTTRLGWHREPGSYRNVHQPVCVKTAETIRPLYKFHTSDQKGPEEQCWKKSIFKSSPFTCHLRPARPPQPSTFR